MTWEGRPLYDTDADKALFVVRDEWNAIARAIEQRNNVLVAGARGTGKTSLLRQLQHALRSQGASVHFVDATAVDSAADLVARIEATVGDEASAPVAPSSSRVLLAGVEHLGRGEPAVYLIDASGSAEALYDLVGRMRDALWRLPHRWVVAVDEDERLTALRPPADAFFDTALSLAPLAPDRLLELLRLRGVNDELGDPSAWDIAAGARGSPRAALRAANEAAVTGRRPSESLSERGRLLVDAAALGRPHGMLMAELLDLGQASPSDEVLQDRLGLSRARITVLLRALLDAGLVETGPARESRPGRPKAIYRPKLEDAG